MGPETRKSIKEFKEEFIKTDEGKKVIKVKLEEARDELLVLNNKLQSVNESAAICPDDVDWFYEDWLKELKEIVRKAKSKLWKFKRLRDRGNGWYVVGEAADIDIDDIKRIPVGDLMEVPVKFKSPGREMYCCPLHDEKNASFVWYKDNNSWYCFGCCKGGSVIDLYMELNDCDFYKAIRELS